MLAALLANLTEPKNTGGFKRRKKEDGLDLSAEALRRWQAFEQQQQELKEQERLAAREAGQEAAAPTTIAAKKTIPDVKRIDRTDTAIGSPMSNETDAEALIFILANI